MKKTIFTLLAFVATLGVNAQGIEIYNGNTLEASYSGSEYTAVLKKTVTSVPVAETDNNLLPGVFTVNAQDGTKVRFTKGNLQATYDATTQKYTFGIAAHQYDVMTASSTSQKAESGNLTIDSQTSWKIVTLFGWQAGSTQNYGISTSTTTSDYSGTTFQDGGNAFPGKGYRTLTSQDLGCILGFNWSGKQRTYANRFARAKVNGLMGLLIFPDNYNNNVAIADGEIQGVGTINQNGPGSFPTASIEPEKWAEMEAAGVVFLPGDGYRSGSTHWDSQLPDYWTSTGSTYDSEGDGPNDGPYITALHFHVDASEVSVNSLNYPYDLYYGCSVRLVKNE